MVRKATVLPWWLIHSTDVQHCDILANSIPRFRADLVERDGGSRIIPVQILAVIKKLAAASQGVCTERKDQWRREASGLQQ